MSIVKVHQTWTQFQSKSNHVFHQPCARTFSYKSIFSMDYKFPDIDAGNDTCCFIKTCVVGYESIGITRFGRKKFGTSV